VIGIDPGLHVTGYGVIDVCDGKVELVEAGFLSTDRRDSLDRRILSIYREIVEVLAEVRPDVMAVEALYSHYRHPRTSIVMAHARGVLFLAAAQAGVKVHSYPATTIKIALTGNGRAKKSQVQAMVGYLLNLEDVPRPPDVADALACALCHVSHGMTGAVSGGGGV